MIDRITARALFAGFIIAALFGWDWDDRQRQTQRDTQQRSGKVGSVVGRGHLGEAE